MRKSCSLFGSNAVFREKYRQQPEKSTNLLSHSFLSILLDFQLWEGSNVLLEEDQSQAV